jgi:antitoxin ParD1/3/4
MTTVNIPLPNAMKAFLDAQVSGGGYSSVSEYVRELVCAEQKRLAKEKLELELELLEALKEPAEDVTPEWWTKLRPEIGAEAKVRRSAHS